MTATTATVAIREGEDNIMRTIRIIFVLALLALSALQTSASAKAPRKNAKITYISSEGVYLDAGSKDGLSVGDTLTVKQGKKLSARLVITNLSSHSAAAKAIDNNVLLKVGDRIKLPNVVTASTESAQPETQPNTRNKKRQASATSSTVNSVKGHLSIGSDLFRDLTGSKRNTYQPSVRSKVTVSNLSGTGLDFQFRHRTRLYHRSRVVSQFQDKNEWDHQVYEFSVTQGGKYSDAPVKWGVGRILVPDVIGMGYVDGGYYSKQLNDHYRAGAALGSMPHFQTSGLQLNRRKIGFFGTYENSVKDKWSLNLSASMSGEYFKDTLSREFVYFQANYNRGEHLKVSQSLEVDFNRSWRFDKTQKRFSISSYYSRYTWRFNKSASAYFSFDIRENVRRYETRTVSDSLFDDRSRQGVRGGFSLRVFDRIALRGSGSVRIRKGQPSNNKLFTLSARINRFPLKRHSMLVQLSALRSQFTSGYRPYLMYRFPVSRRLLLNVTASAYIYKVGTEVTNNYFINLNTSYTFGTRYYLYADLRQYLDSDLQSTEIFTELGIDF